MLLLEKVTDWMKKTGRLFRYLLEGNQSFRGLKEDGLLQVTWKMGKEKAVAARGFLLGSLLPRDSTANIS